MKGCDSACDGPVSHYTQCPDSGPGAGAWLCSHSQPAEAGTLGPAWNDFTPLSSHFHHKQAGLTRSSPVSPGDNQWQSSQPVISIRNKLLVIIALLVWPESAHKRYLNRIGLWNKYILHFLHHECSWTLDKMIIDKISGLKLDKLDISSR